MEKVSLGARAGAGRRVLAAGRRRPELPNPAVADAECSCQSEAVVMRVP